MEKRNFILTTLFFTGCLFLLLVLNLSSVSAQQKSSLKLGINLDVTGSAGWTGEPCQRGIQLFVDQINAKGGINSHPLELVIYDNESNPEKSATITKKLIQRDNVIAIFGTVLASTSNAAKPFAQEEKIVLYTFSASFEPNYPDSFSFSTMVPTIGMVESIYDYLTEKKMKRVAILCGTDSTGQTWFEETNKAAKKYGFEVANERFNIKDMDVTAQLTKLKAFNPQSLVVGSAGIANGVVVKNFNQMGFKIPYITGSGNVSDSFLKMMVGNEPDLLLLPAPYYVVWRELPDSFPQKRLMQEFTEAFQKKFQKEADMYAAEAYDGARIVAEAIRQVNATGQKDGVKIRDAIEKIKGLPAVYGKTYTLSKSDHRGHYKEALVMVQVKEGKFVMAK